jgi:phospholipid:diacylglycerol acyltransferase
MDASISATTTTKKKKKNLAMSLQTRQRTYERRVSFDDRDRSVQNEREHLSPQSRELPLQTMKANDTDGNDEDDNNNNEKKKKGASRWMEATTTAVKKNREKKIEKKIEKQMNKRSFRGFFLGLSFAMIGSYLRLMIVPDAVRDHVTEKYIPSWFNESFLSMLPALNPDFIDAYNTFGSTYYNGTEHLIVARQVREEYEAKPNHPVVIVPGFVNTGLELWKSKPCIAKRTSFRQRMWGTPAMMKAFFHNRTCWFEHMGLDARTGEDPDGITLRPVSGIDAVDWFMPGYFVWGRMIEALGEIGYTGSNLHVASYDWRLSPERLEIRDGYFTKLKKSIEGLKETENEKIALLAHSYGDTLSRYFLEWVESPKGGKGGSNWVSEHIANYVNIAGPTLGMPKAVSTLISGEMRDTAILNELEMTIGPLISTFVEKLIGNLEEVTLVFRSWSSLWSMLPIGGDFIWGGLSETSTKGAGDVVKDEILSADVADANFLTIREFPTSKTKKKKNKKKDALLTGLTMKNSLHFLYDLAKQTTPNNVKMAMEKRKKDKWFGHPLHSKLPNAPKMKIFCFYGVGKSTERSYKYTKQNHGLEKQSSNEQQQQQLQQQRTTSTSLTANNSIQAKQYKLDVELDSTEKWQKGTISVDGDGSIPLVSLGYPCLSTWRTKQKNPSSIPIKIREYTHTPRSVLEGGFQGTSEGEHVNIMGNVDMIKDVLRVCTGTVDDATFKEQIVSDIKSIARKIDSKKNGFPSWSSA